MKKLIYVLYLLMSAVIVSQCTEKGKEKERADKTASGDSKTRLDTLCKGDYTIYNQKNNYANLDIRKVYVDDAEFLKKENQIAILKWDPHPKSDFKRDSASFYDRFIKPSPSVLVNSESFPIPIADLYLVMQTELGITDISEDDIFGNEIVKNGMRIYPAMSTGADGKKSLYIVLLGEEAKENGTYDLVLTSMRGRSQNYYSVKEGQFSKIAADSDKQKAESDIKDFQKFWKDEFSTLDTSYSFSIESYYEMLATRHLNIYKWRKDPSQKYGIVLYPCLSQGNKLFFVAKGYKENAVSRSISTFESNYFYDNMDVCPRTCPLNGIN
jgi:hypothetical protein